MVNMVFINIILTLKSIIMPTVFLFLLVISSSFWGKVILKVLKLNDKYKNGELLPLISGFALMMALGQYIYEYVDNYLIFLNIFYYIGLGGCAIYNFNIFSKYIKNYKYNKINIYLIILKYDNLIILILSYVIIAFIYSKAMPTGKLSPWINLGADFYSWIFISEYYLGFINTINLELLPNFYKIAQYNLGVYLLIDLISIISGYTPMNAAPIIVTILLALISASIYTLVKLIFKFNQIISFIISLGVTISPFMNYIAINGLFGQLIGVLGFLVGIEQIIKIAPKIDNNIKVIKILFYPLLLIFLAYESSFILYFGLILILFGLILIFNNRDSKQFIVRINIAIKTCSVVFIVISFFFIILMPGVAYHLIMRSLEVINQKEGWPLPFLQPWLFLGLPIYIWNRQFHHEYLPSAAELTYIGYLFLIILIIFLNIIYIKNLNNKCSNYKNSELNTVKNNLSMPINCIGPISLLYLFSLVLYLVAYSINGNIYQIWKYASYSILPLSFVPISLITIIVIQLMPRRIKYLAYSFIIILLVYVLVKIFNFRFMNDLMVNYYITVPATSYITHLNQIKKDLPAKSIILIDTDSYAKKLIATIMLNNNYTLRYTKGLYYLYGHSFYFDILNKNSYILSDTLYENLISGFDERISIGSQKLYLYNYNTIKEYGYVAIKAGMFIFDWKLNKYPIYTRLLVPNQMIGRNIKFLIDIDKLVEDDDCNILEIGVKDKNNTYQWIKQPYNEANIFINSDLTETGVLEIITKIDTSNNFIDNKEQINKNSDDFICKFEIKSFKLELTDYK
jgi:hypothetical protein